MMDTKDRQTGRTTKQLCTMLQHLRENPMHRALFVTHGERMAVQASEMLGDLAPDGEWYATHRVTFRSATAGLDTLRGYVFDYVDLDHCVDEFAPDRAAEMRALLPAFMSTRATSEGVGR